MRRTNVRLGIGSQRGFTLTELIIVLSIMVIVVAIALPSMGQYMRHSRLKEAARMVENDFEQARTAARTRQERNVVAQISGDRIFSFIDANENATYDAGETLISDDLFTGGVSLTITSTTVGAAVPFSTVNYNALGNIRDSTNRVVTVSITGESRQFRITVYSTGSIRVDRSEDAGADNFPTRAW